MRNEKKQFLVIGMGRFGASVAKTLTQMGHEVLAMDRDARIVDDIAPFVTQAVQGNATDDEILMSLGVENYDSIVVSIASNMRDSILICMLLKEIKARHIVAKAMDDLHAKVLQKIGVDRVIFPERDMGQRTARALVMPQMMETMNLSDLHEIVEIEMPADWDDHTLGQLDVRKKYDLSVLAIRRGTDMLVSPRADFRFASGDVLLVLGEKEKVRALERL